MTEARAKVTIYKPRFLEKAWIRTFKMRDANNKKLTSSLTLFIPKLTPKYPRPALFLHLKNGAGSCYCRVDDPNEIQQPLEFLQSLLTTDTFTDTWRHMSDLGDRLVAGESIMVDEKYLDKNAFVEDPNFVDHVEDQNQPLRERKNPSQNTAKSKSKK